METTFLVHWVPEGQTTMSIKRFEIEKDGCDPAIARARAEGYRQALLDVGVALVGEVAAQ